MGQAETDFFGNLVAGVRFLEWTLIFGCPISTPIVRPHYVRKPIEKTTALCTVLYVQWLLCHTNHTVNRTTTWGNGKTIQSGDERRHHHTNETVKSTFRPRKMTSWQYEIKIRSMNGIHNVDG